MKSAPTPTWIRDALFACAYGAAFYALFQSAHLFWYLPAGLRFLALLSSPWRRWPWLLAVEVLVFVGMRYAPLQTPHGLFAIVANPLLAASGPYLLKRADWTLRSSSPSAMTRLIAAMALAAIGATLGNLLYPFVESARLSPVRVLLQLVLGDYVGILAIVPLALVLLREPPHAAMRRRWRFDVPIVLLPVSLAYLWLAARSGESQVFFLAALLGFAPSLYFATRSGWRGAALALSVSSLAVACSGALVGNAELAVEAQGFLAIAGSIILLLGAAHDTLRENRRELEAGYLRLELLTADLRDAARRNLELSEHTRRWVTAELHDEIGQNLTALQTRVRLLERKSGLEDSELATDLRATLARMRGAVSGLMANLRPAGLDDFGLRHALRDGTVRELLESNGIAFDLRVDDDANRLDGLDNDVQTALYRIVQEAATNTVRHAHATRFGVRLRMRMRTGGHGDSVVLAIADDGVGFDPAGRVRGIGVQGIRDRVLALGGRLRLRSDGCGTRLVARTPLAAAATGTQRR